MGHKIHLGYACLNTSLPIRMKTLRLKTYREKGNIYLKTLILHNLGYIRDCLIWNQEHSIDFFRVSSDTIPLATHPEMSFLWQEDREILEVCKQIQRMALAGKMRLSMHPGQYTLLNSPSPEVVRRSKEDLQYHHILGKLIGVSDLIIHVGGVYGNKVGAMERWLEEFQGLHLDIQKMLRLENDERSFDLEDVLHLSRESGVPVVLDFHHHRIKGSLDLTDNIAKVVDTWKKTGLPKFHLSSGREGPADPRHHPYVLRQDYDWAIGIIKTVLMEERIYLMLEAKAKEQAVLRLQQYSELKR